MKDTGSIWKWVVESEYKDPRKYHVQSDKHSSKKMLLHLVWSRHVAHVCAKIESWQSMPRTYTTNLRNPPSWPSPRAIFSHHHGNSDKQGRCYQGRVSHRLSGGGGRALRHWPWCCQKTWPEQALNWTSSWRLWQWLHHQKSDLTERKQAQLTRHDICFLPASSPNKRLDKLRLAEP